MNNQASDNTANQNEWDSFPPDPPQTIEQLEQSISVAIAQGDKAEEKNVKRQLCCLKAQEKIAHKLGEQETRRQQSGRARILAALKTAGPKGCTNAELAAIQLRYGGRLHELGEMGYYIKSEHVSGGLWRYTIINSLSDL